MGIMRILNESPTNETFHTIQNRFFSIHILNIVTLDQNLMDLFESFCFKCPERILHENIKIHFGHYFYVL